MNVPLTSLLLVVGLALGASYEADSSHVTDAPDGASATLADAELNATLNEVVEDYCVRCHSDRRLTGNLSLEDFDVASPSDQAEIAERIIHKVRAGMMPPVDTRRPPEDTLSLLVTTLEETLDAAARENPNPGYRTFQRLNRAEYRTAVRELFGLEIDPSAFLPNETLSENFDNIADMQMLSATVMEGYLRAAAHVARAAVGDADASPASSVYKVPKNLSQMRHVEGAPLGTRGGTSVLHNFPADGNYVFEIDLHPIPTGQLYGSTSPDEQLEISINGERVAILDIDRWSSESDPTGLRSETPPVYITAGQHRLSAAFIQKFEGPVVDLLTPVDYTLADSQIGSAYGVTTGPHLRDLVVTGPFDPDGVSETEARRRIFSCTPADPADERPCAESIIRDLAAQAYRRPVEDRDVTDLLQFYEQGYEKGGFEIGVRTALQAMLASPDFIFRLEEAAGSAGEVYEIADLDLATRLAFFLWAAPPDAELIEVARQGRLSDVDVLEQQARRLLADPRAETLATRFASQWLRLQDLEKIYPDALLYPYYDYTLSRAMDRETELLFHHIVQENESVLDLLDAEYTFVNERLARHYGIAGVAGNQFQMVPVPRDERRGLLGHGSILTMTSHANRTSPVIRGKWVMEVLLGTPPPPPPPVGVPSFDETSAAVDGRELTTRERQEMHRANPACNSCHKVIDVIGLALDNYDVTGAWRIKENDAPIDAGGELFDGTPISGPSDLRDAILARPTVFVRTFARNLMAYALGRRVEYFDMPTIRAIEAEAAADDYRMEHFILGVVKSPAFRMSMAESVADDADQN